MHSALTPPGRAQEKQSTLGDTVLYVEWRVVWGDGEPEWMSDGALLGASGFAEACVNFLAEVPVPPRPRICIFCKKEKNLRGSPLKP